MHNGHSANRAQASLGHQNKAGGTEWNRPRRGSYCQYKQQKINASLMSLEDRPIAKLSYPKNFGNETIKNKKSSVNFYQPQTYIETKNCEIYLQQPANNYLKQKYTRDDNKELAKPSATNLITKENFKFDNYEYQNKLRMRNFDLTNERTRESEKAQYRSVIGTIKSSSNQKNKQLKTDLTYTDLGHEFAYERSKKYGYKDQSYLESTSGVESYSRPQSGQDDFMNQYMDKYNRYTKNQDIQSNIKYGHQRRYDPTNYQQSQQLYRGLTNQNGNFSRQYDSELISQKSCEFSSFYKQKKDPANQYRFTSDLQINQQLYPKQQYRPRNFYKTIQEQKYCDRNFNITPAKGKLSIQQFPKQQQEPLNSKREQLISKSKVLRDKLNEFSAEKKLLTSASKSGKQFSVEMKTQSQQQRLQRLKNARERIYNSPFKEGTSFSNNLKTKGQQKYKQNNEKSQTILRYKQNYCAQIPITNETMSQLKLITKQRVPVQEKLSKFTQQRVMLSRQQSESINRINVLNSKINEKINSIICSYGK